MRSTLVVGVAFLAAAACTKPDGATATPPGVNAPPLSSAAAPTTPAPPATVRYVGRFDTSDPNAVRFAWSGSSIVTRFKGTGISARMKDEGGRNYFQVIVDGEPKSVLKTDPTKEVYPLVDGLPDGEHEVALYKRTEARVGEILFRGFDPKGTILPVPQGPERRIELIGDSITAGFGNEGPNATCPFVPSEENQYNTYGAIAARALGAEHVTIAWSGKTIGEMTEYYERTLPARPESKWDFKAWIPHLVVLNVGTNNFAVFDPGQERYVRVYTALFNRVRAAYPSALIVCLLGPMLSDAYPVGKNNLTLARKYMQATMEKIRASGETNFEYVELPEQKHSDGLGCGFHPSVKTHKLMADRLVGVAKEKLRW